MPIEPITGSNTVPDATIWILIDDADIAAVIDRNRSEVDSALMPVAVKSPLYRI